jgi:hypothetical protein
LGVEHAASSGPAGRWAGLGPIVKREPDIDLVDASAAVPAGGTGRMIGYKYLRPPSFASRSVRFLSDPRCVVTLSQVAHHESKPR